MTRDEKWTEKKMDRREFLKKAGIGGAGLALGLSGASAFFTKEANDQKDAALGKEQISFYGRHQAGITTPMQKHCYLVVLDLHSTDRSTIIQLFKDWTDYSQKLVDGLLVDEHKKNKLLPPADTGETMGLNPYRLTLTFGVSNQFLKKLGLENKRPKAFKEFPAFAREQLRENYTGGDIVIQACADEEQICFHAIRNLVRKGRNQVTMRWSQSGFAAIGDGLETPRNLFGFKDGTANARKKRDMDDVVWSEEPGWIKGGSYMAVRRIQMLLETWDRTSLQEQEFTFGRYKISGAPLGKKNEFDEVDLELRDEKGNLYVPEDSHVRLAKEAGVPIYRRSYSYSTGIDEVTGQFDTGLLFISFQKDPQNFVKIQESLGNDDKMNEYTTHVGSGLFACFSGVEKGEYIGQKLFE